MGVTGEELAARLNAEQGYLVAADERLLSVGFIILPEDHQCTGIPIRVVGPATEKEYRDQAALANKIAPNLAAGPPFTKWPHYYRVEATD